MSTLSAGNHRVRTASSASDRALYPLLSRCSFSGVMGMAPTFTPGPRKLGTKTCLQKGAYPSTRPAPAAWSAWTSRTNAALSYAIRVPPYLGSSH
jgi:hypothetical protein